MLNSLEIYHSLNALGVTLEAGRYEPSYASEHALGNGNYLYVKRKSEGVISKSPLVLAPETINLREEIDSIPGLFCHWEKTKSSSYRRFPKDGSSSQYGYDADVESADALKLLVELLTGKSLPELRPRVEKNKEMINVYPLNQILFGPPGTGKTYATTELAVKISDSEWYQNVVHEYDEQSLREVIKARYQALVEKQRIMFTTFHQSFSYEDFIEGIRATTDETSGNLRYEVVNSFA